MRWLWIPVGVGVLFAAVIVVGFTQLPGIGAGGLLHPARRAVTGLPPKGCDDATFAGDEGLRLRGWRCRTAGPRRATLVYLHGIADNRTSAAGVIERLGARGFDTIAYDSRSHGDSDGDLCTYGFFEKRDLHRVLDAIEAGPIVLMGTSLGAAVAIQEAADDSRVAAIVAAETFSDLRTVAIERAPWFFTSGVIARAFRLAEQQAHFSVDEVNPAAAAARISSPVLLIHGAADVDTPPDHSRRVLAALSGIKRLILVPGAGHNESLRGQETWDEIDRWLEVVLARPGRNFATAISER